MASELIVGWAGYDNETVHLQKRSHATVHQKVWAVPEAKTKSSRIKCAKFVHQECDRNPLEMLVGAQELDPLIKSRRYI